MTEKLLNKILPVESEPNLQDLEPNFSAELHSHANSESSTESLNIFSTQTAIIYTNLTFDLPNLFRYLPITYYAVVKKRRGRKKKDDIFTSGLENLPIGCLTGSRYKWEVKGDFEAKKKFFLNCVEYHMIIDTCKRISIKVNTTGNVHIAGCKTEAQQISAIQHLYRHMQEAGTFTNEVLFTHAKDIERPHATIRVVLKNININIGFGIQRDKVYDFFRKNNSLGYIPHYLEMTSNTNVNVKLPNQIKETEECLRVFLDNFETERVYVPFVHKKEESYHTFMVFCSGSINYSGNGSNDYVHKVTEDFIKLFIDHKEELKE